MDYCSAAYCPWLRLHVWLAVFQSAVRHVSGANLVSGSSIRQKSKWLGDFILITSCKF